MHWYRGGTRVFWDQTIRILGNFDRTLAVLVTLRHLFQPLYQDRTIIGYILGFIFRVLRVFIGVVIYLVVTLGALALYVAWVLVPPYILYKIAEGLIL